MIKIAILDDDSIQLAQIKQIVDKYIELKATQPLQVRAFSSSKALFNERYEKGNFDIYILDIVMPEINGIDVGLTLRKENDQGHIIYLTSNDEFAVDSYQTRAFHYLLKPVKGNQLDDVLSMAIEKINHNQMNTIEIKTPSQLLTLSKNVINYVELSFRRMHYYLEDGSMIESVALHDSFKNLMAPLLKHPSFVQAGASFVINLHQIKSISKDYITFLNGTVLQLPKTAIPSLKSTWIDYWFNMD